jgi:nanoRNase/pAp phosphatase (c-di-AMP/oligoRNAs hydrolase)
MAFNQVFNYLKGKSILITSHNLVDLDGFVSSLLLDFFLRELHQNNRVSIYFSGISKYTIDFMNNFITIFPDFKYYPLNEFNPSDFDIIVILDTNNLDLVDNLDDKNLDHPFIFIDHHLNLNNKYKMNLESYNIIYEDYTSTAEILFEIFDLFDVSIPLPYKYLLASAILTDSGFLKYANSKTLIHLSKILQEEIEYQDIIGLFNNITDLSEKIAKIKGLQRVKLLRLEDWLIGISHVSSYSASVATMLIGIGFDISIVYAKEKSEYRITTRANKAICAKTGLHLGKILHELSNGNGGGHEGAASLNGDINIEKFLESLLDTIKKILIKKQSY